MRGVNKRETISIKADIIFNIDELEFSFKRSRDGKVQLYK